MKSSVYKYFRISKFTASGGLKVILMSMQRLFLLIMILALGCRTVSAERSSSGTTSETNEKSPIRITNETLVNSEAVTETVPEEISSMQKEQIELNKTALLTFSDKTGRINAASLLLLNQSPYAEEVLEFIRQSTCSYGNL